MLYVGYVSWSTVTLFQKSAAQVLTEGSGDARANLMEAIRQAGGSEKAKLRSAKDLKIEAKKKKQVGLKKMFAGKSVP
jgi:hypothetical protein